MRKPPSREVCLWFAKHYYDRGNEKYSWDYLIIYGFYEMWIDGYWQTDD